MAACMDEMLYKRLEKTLLLPEDIKQDLLRYFENLTSHQIQILSELLQAENSILLDFLRKQKDSGNIPAAALREKYIEYYKKRNIEREQKEIQEEQENLDALLENL